MNKEKIKKAYTEILDVAIKYKDIGKEYGFGDIETIIEEAKKHLWGIELWEKYGLDVPHENIGRNCDFIRIEDRYLCFFGEENRRTIGWEDNGKQVEEGEFLFQVGFATGAYIFGDDYPEEIFQEFWNEIKSYNPKYCDSHNHCMYFSMDNAGKIFNEYNAILKKYNEKNREDFKLRRIKKMEDDLKKLKENK